MRLYGDTTHSTKILLAILTGDNVASEEDTEGRSLQDSIYVIETTKRNALPRKDYSSYLH